MTGFEALPDLASRRLGGGVVFANDEFFAAADNLVNPWPASFEARTFGPKGQVYDGWETRRRRDGEPGAGPDGEPGAGPVGEPGAGPVGEPGAGPDGDSASGGDSGPDHAIVRLGAPGLVRGVVIDTAHFTGNYPP